MVLVQQTTSLVQETIVLVQRNTVAGGDGAFRRLIVVGGGLVIKLTRPGANVDNCCAQSLIRETRAG